MSESPQPFDTWAIVEVMGHQTFPGRVTEQTVAGVAFVRVDVPETTGEYTNSDGAPGFTKLFGPGSIYCITPVSEQVATAAAERIRPQPITVYMPELRPPAATQRALSPRAEIDDDW